MWVRQADIDDGYAPGVSTTESARVKQLEQENRELKRANEILKRTASFFGAELEWLVRTEVVHGYLHSVESNRIPGVRRPLRVSGHHGVSHRSALGGCYPFFHGSILYLIG